MNRFSRFTNNTLVGQSLKHGTLESLGFNIEGFGRKAVNKGFFGTGLGASAAGKIALAKEAEKQAASGVTRGLLGRAGGAALRGLGGISTAYFMYQGYKEGGILGAAKEGAYSIAASTAFQYVGAALGGAGMAVVGGAAAIAAGGYASYALGEAGRRHASGLRQLEMGQQDQMQAALSSAGAATMRQRSVMALNNTHLNGRMSLGQEGYLIHRSFGGY